MLDLGQEPSYNLSKNLFLLPRILKLIEDMVDDSTPLLYHPIPLQKLVKFRKSYALHENDSTKLKLFQNSTTIIKTNIDSLAYNHIESMELCFLLLYVHRYNSIIKDPPQHQ